MRSTRCTTARPATALPRLSPAVLEAALIKHIGRERYDLWFTQHTRLKPAAGEIVIGVPNLHLQEWLSQRFGKEVGAAVRDAAGRSLPVHFVIDPDLFQAARAKQKATQENPPSAKVEPVQVRTEPAHESQYAERPPPGLFDAAARGEVAVDRNKGRSRRHWRRLEEFVVGACNRVALAASQSAVESPGQGPS